MRSKEMLTPYSNYSLIVSQLLMDLTIKIRLLVSSQSSINKNSCGSLPFPLFLSTVEPHAKVVLVTAQLGSLALLPRFKLLLKIITFYTPIMTTLQLSIAVETSG